MVRRLAIPPNALDPNTMCVWVTLSAFLGVDARILWAIYVSSLPVGDRAPYATGTVPYTALTSILQYFPLPYTVYPAHSADPGCPRGPGMAPGPAGFNPNLPPLFKGVGLPGWPELTAYLQHNDDGTYHITHLGVADAAAVYNPPPPGGVIGWPSKLVPPIEIAEVVNVPAQAFATVYRRLLGTARNFLTPFPSAPRLNNMVIPAVPVVEQVVTYVPTAADSAYACALASDIKTRPQVLNLHEFNSYDTARTIDTMAKEMHLFVTTGHGFPYRPVNLHLLHGAYGTGKTHALERLLRQAHQLTPFNSANLSFHTWDHDLREPLKNGMMQALPNIGLRSSNFMTGCMPLAQPRSGTIVLDDAGKCWNSFIPLMLAMNPGITDVYVTFDVCQAQGVFPEAPSISRKHPSTAKWLGNMSDHYATNVVRTAPDVTRLLGFPVLQPAGHIQQRGQVIVVSQCPAGVPLLAVSPRFTQTQNMGGQVADTFTECQGHTIYGDVCIDLGGLTATATDAAAWTALTRATGNIYLKMGASMSKSTLIESSWSGSQILTALLTLASVRGTPYLTPAEDVDGIVRSATMSHLSRCLSPGAAASLGLPAPAPVVGVRPYVSAPVRQSWLDSLDRSDIYTARTHKARFSSSRSSPSSAFSRHSAITSDWRVSPVAHTVRHLTSVHNGSVLNSTSTGYTLPEDPCLVATADPVNDIEEPTDDALREIVVGPTSTFQHIPDGAPAALHHTRADKLTDELGKLKRIRVGEHKAPWSPNDERRLRSLKKGFKKFFDIGSWNNEPFNPALMDKCNDLKLASWASKRTKKALSYSVDKQNLDSPYNFVKLFPKGQYIKKKAKWRSHAFPSQTVSDFHLGRIFRDSPYAVYLETQILRWAYPTTYLHCRASPDDVSNWYKTHWSPGIMTGNDYTAWDSGVDHVFLEFDIWLMSVCHFPAEFIDQFRQDRLTTYSHLGPHMPRQESGDRWTWILNTARNAALTGASLDCPPKTPICVSGDDSVTLGAWRRTTGFNPADWIMQPKREEGTVMEFCGLIFGGTDVTFDSAVVHWRAQFGLQQGRNDPDYWRSIRDAIRESAHKLGSDSPKLSSARLNLERAVHWFDLPTDLLLHPAPLPGVAIHPPSW